MTAVDQSLREKAINIKGKDYVQVKDRILYLDQHHNGMYSIITDYAHYPERKVWVVKATLKIGDQTFTGLAQELESDDPGSVNHSSALENAETSAVGRACAMAGIGVLDSVASADEMSKAISRQKAALAEAKAMPEITYSHIVQPAKGTCKKCGKVTRVEKLRSPTRFGSTHVLTCECGEKTWFYPGGVTSEAIPNPEFGELPSLSS